MNNELTINTDLIASKINAAGNDYNGEKVKGWSGGKNHRIYFGKQYVSIVDGVPTHKENGTGKRTIGEYAVHLVSEAMK